MADWQGSNVYVVFRRTLACSVNNTTMCPCDMTMWPHSISGVNYALYDESHGYKSSSHGRSVTCEASPDDFWETKLVCLFKGPRKRPRPLLPVEASPRDRAKSRASGRSATRRTARAARRRSAIARACVCLRCALSRE
eukprot:6175462-Pleurochrysis_carterae.AAC.1